MKQNEFIKSIRTYTRLYGVYNCISPCAVHVATFLEMCKQCSYSCQWMHVSAANVVCCSCLTHPKIIIVQGLYRTTDIGQDKAENRESQGSRTHLSSKSRVKLNISVVKTLTAVTDRPTVYVCVTPLAKWP